MKSMALKFKGNMTVVEIDPDEDGRAAVVYHIEEIPTIVFCRDGIEIERCVGIQSERFLTTIVEALLKRGK